LSAAVKAGGFVRIKLSDVQRILDLMTLSNYQKDIPLFYGPPGIGKTECVEDWVLGMQQKDEEWYLRTLILSQFDPTELKGFPYVDHEGEFRFAALKTLPQKGPSLLFFDELSTSNKEVQNVTLRLFSQKELGDYKVPERVYMAAAANHHQDVGVFVQKLSTAMKTRFATYYIDVDFDEWKKWAMTHDIEPGIVYFLQQNQEMLINIDANKDSMPSPRSWANLSFQMSNMRKAGMSPEKNFKIFLPEIIARVGGEVAGRFQNYVEVYSKVDVDGIMQHGHYPDNIGTTQGDFAIMGACVGALRDPKYPVSLDVTKNFIGCLGHMNSEFSVCMIGDLLKGTPFLDRIRKYLKGTPERAKYESLLDKYVNMLKDD